MEVSHHTNLSTFIIAVCNDAIPPRVQLTHGPCKYGTGVRACVRALFSIVLFYLSIACCIIPIHFVHELILATGNRSPRHSKKKPATIAFHRPLLHRTSRTVAEANADNRRRWIHVANL